MYESQRTLLPAYASFFCLLALAFVFSQRHRMARAMFAPRLLWPDEMALSRKFARGLSINAALATMIFGALACTAIYLWAFEIGRPSPTFPRLPPTSMNAVLLALSFITLFLLASAAFAVVAVREHIQKVLGLSDAEVITGCRDPTQVAAMPRPLRITRRHQRGRGPSRHHACRLCRSGTRRSVAKSCSSGNRRHRCGPVRPIPTGLTARYFS